MKWIKYILLGLLVLIIGFTSFQYFGYLGGIRAVEEAMPEESQIIETAAGSVEYQIQGSSDNYILLIHGTPGSYRTFMADVLVNEGFSVISPSRPGYFRTPLSSGRTIEAQADLYVALLNALDIDSAAILGFSGGGPSAIKFAARHPNRCTGLVVISSAGRTFEEPKRGTIEELMMGSEFGRWLAFGSLNSQFKSKDTADIALDYIRSGFFPKDQTDPGEENDYDQFLSPWEADLTSIQCPTLIIHGTEDELIPYSEATYLDQNIANSTLFKAEGKDHFTVVFYEFDKYLNEAADFLNKN